jgi:hypothetical protein
MGEVQPWAQGPFDLLRHAEEHLRKGEDFDRRMALISFDNAIEVTISTYLTLHPSFRENRKYQKVDVERWMAGYHSMLDFLDTELTSRGLPWRVDRHEIAWAHENRNEQYHGGKMGVPELRVLIAIRDAAYWIFTTLFRQPGVQILVDESIRETIPTPPQRNKAYDKAIDDALGKVVIAGQEYSVSEALFSVDYEVYKAMGAELCGPVEATEAKKPLHD